MSPKPRQELVSSQAGGAPRNLNTMLLQACLEAQPCFPTCKPPILVCLHPRGPHMRAHVWVHAHVNPVWGLGGARQWPQGGCHHHTLLADTTPSQGPHEPTMHTHKAWCAHPTSPLPSQSHAWAWWNSCGVGASTCQPKCWALVHCPLPTPHMLGIVHPCWPMSPNFAHTSLSCPALCA